MRILSSNPTETLKHFDMNLDEFMNELEIGKSCSGMKAVDCDSINCSECPIHGDKSYTDIRTWLDGSIANDNNARLIALETKLDLVLSLLQKQSKEREII